MSSLPVKQINSLKQSPSDIDRATDKNCLFSKSILLKGAVDCNGCNNQIHQLRWRCLHCSDYNLCVACKFDTKKTHGHSFVAVPLPPDFQSSVELDVPRDAATMIQCDHCNAITNQIRWKCSCCANYDLCNSCYTANSNNHDKSHPFYGLYLKHDSEYNTRVSGETYSCNICSQSITDLRFSCNQCYDYDICKSCIDSAKVQHSMVTIAGEVVQHDWVLNLNCIKYDYTNVPKQTSEVTLIKSFRCSNCTNVTSNSKYKCDICSDYVVCHQCYPKVREFHQNHIFSRFNEFGLDGTTVASQDIIQNAEVVQENESHIPPALLDILDPSVEVICDGCDSIITGIHFKCGFCVSYDLCQKCEENCQNLHLNSYPGHPFIKFTEPFNVLKEAPLLSANIYKHEITQCTDRETFGSCCGNKPIHLNSNNLNDLTFLNAHFVEDATVPDGTKLQPNEHFTKIWNVTNTGDKLWPLNTKLVQIDGDNLTNPSSNVPVVTIGNKFEKVGIVVDMISPSKAGRYITKWRFMTPDGKYFGDMLWCDVEVVENTGTQKNSYNKNNLAANLTQDLALVLGLEKFGEMVNKNIFDGNNGQKVIQALDRSIGPLNLVNMAESWGLLSSKYKIRPNESTNSQDNKTCISPSVSLNNSDLRSGSLNTTQQTIISSSEVSNIGSVITDNKDKKASTEIEKSIIANNDEPAEIECDDCVETSVTPHKSKQEVKELIQENKEINDVENINFLSRIENELDDATEIHHIFPKSPSILKKSIPIIESPINNDSKLKSHEFNELANKVNKLEEMVKLLLTNSNPNSDKLDESIRSKYCYSDGIDTRNTSVFNSVSSLTVENRTNNGSCRYYYEMDDEADLVEDIDNLQFSKFSPIITTPDNELQDHEYKISRSISETVEQDYINCENDNNNSEVKDAEQLSRNSFHSSYDSGLERKEDLVNSKSLTRSFDSISLNHEANGLVEELSDSSGDDGFEFINSY